MPLDKNKKTIIFDFDGTIADTFEHILDQLDQYSGDFGVEIADKNVLEELRSMSISDILKRFRIPKFVVPFILKKVQKNLSLIIDNIYPFNDVLSEIKNLHGNYNMGILTSNSVENVDRFLKKENVSDVFDFIYSDRSLFGKHKILNKFVKKYKLSKENIVYVGDEARDVEACNKAGIKVVSVGWGFNSSKLLRRVNEDNYVETAKEMTKKIKNILK